MRASSNREWLRLKLLQLRGSLWARSHVPTRRVVFVHIPKCAGQSVTQFVKAHVGSQGSGRTTLLSDGIPGETLQQKVERAKHSTFVAGHFGWRTLQQIRKPDDFVFTFLRDPLERLRSAYTFVRYHHCRRGEPVPSFKEFIASTDPVKLMWTHNAMARQLAMSFDQRSLELSNEELAEEAIRHLDTFDYVGFYDTFGQDFTEIMQSCGLPTRRVAPYFNRTPPSADQDDVEHLMPELSCRLEADYKVYREALRRRAEGETPARMSSG